MTGKRRVPTRRAVLKKTATITAATFLPRLWFTPRASAESTYAPIVAAAIGVGPRGAFLARSLEQRAVLAAVADVDLRRARRFAADRRVDASQDYRRILERKDIEVVAIATPDHWHAALCIEAVRSGKDVYCEKPLTLTINEGKAVCRAVEETRRIVQVGTQQRSEFGRRYLRAVALARSARVGKIRQCIVRTGMAPSGGPFRSGPAPAGLDWDSWLGQAPSVAYSPERCHGSYRWWQEYSGGVVTDSGVHDMDIAQWGIGMEASGPTLIEPLEAEIPVFEASSFNTVTRAMVHIAFPNGATVFLEVLKEPRLEFEAEHGIIHVGRQRFKTKLFDYDKDWLEQEVVRLLRGREPRSHLDDFLMSVCDRLPPISDVFSHHRALTTCHLANIALRTGRVIRWNPNTEEAVGDDEINQRWLARERRRGFELPR